MKTESWEYIVGVQLNRDRERTEVSIHTRQIIESNTPPEEWLRVRGDEGWELAAVVHRGEYTEFFMKRRTGTSTQARIYLSADALQRDFGETSKNWVAGTRWITALVKEVNRSGVLAELAEPSEIGRVLFDKGSLFLPWKMIGLLDLLPEDRDQGTA